MKDAARKAALYSGAANAKLGRILRIVPLDGSAPPMERSFKMLAAPAPAPPVESGSQTLSSNVRVTWELLP